LFAPARELARRRWGPDAMFVVLRFISLILIVLALLLLGADIITSLEKGGQITVRSIEQVWGLFSKGGVVSFKAWLEHTLPVPLPSWIEAVLRIPAWGLSGVIGVFLAFLFGRRAGGD
jgi:hypothetical protein